MIVRQSIVEPVPTERGASRCAGSPVAVPLCGSVPACHSLGEGRSPNAFPSPFPEGEAAFSRVIQTYLRLFKAIQSYLRVLLKKNCLKSVPACRQPSTISEPAYAGKPVVRCCKALQAFANLCKHFFKNHFLCVTPSAVCKSRTPTGVLSISPVVASSADALRATLGHRPGEIATLKELYPFNPFRVGGILGMFTQRSPALRDNAGLIDGTPLEFTGCVPRCGTGFRSLSQPM